MASWEKLVNGGWIECSENDLNRNDWNKSPDGKCTFGIREPTYTEKDNKLQTAALIAVEFFAAGTEDYERLVEYIRYALDELEEEVNSYVHDDCY